MKVRTDYSDGHFDVIGATPDDLARGYKHNIEITDEEWRRYCLHLEECRKWHNWALFISNSEYALVNQDYPVRDDERVRHAALVQEILANPMYGDA